MKPCHRETQTKRVVEMNELQSLSQIFQNRLFRIPDYQRGYAWLNPQLVDFWDDLINLQPDRYHYTGLLSLKPMTKIESKKLEQDDQWLIRNGYRAYYVVDGQQRLTTFVILLHEIISFVQCLPENVGKAEDGIYFGYESLKDIRDKYICRYMPPLRMVTTYLFGYENDNPSAEFLKYKIFGQKYGGTIRETYYTKNLKNAKSFFAREITALYERFGTDSLTNLYHKLTLKLMFNIHEIEDDYDVYIAFETMNNRGKPLTNLELLKNRLIYLTTLYGDEELDQENEIALREKINRAWKEVYYQLGRNENIPLSDDEFLRAHWIIYFTYSRKKGDDYIKFLLRRFSHKSIFRESTDPVGELDAINESEQIDTDEETENEAGFVQAPIDGSGYLSPSEIANYVNSLNETAEYWYYSFFPEECASLSSAEKLWLDRLNRLGIGYFRPLITVSLIPCAGVNEEDRVAFFKAIERFIFVNFRMASYQSSYLSSDFYRRARELYRHEVSIQDLTEELDQKTDLNAPDAINAFVLRMNQRFDSADGFYSWRDLRYFLFEYEYSLTQKYKIEKIDWGMLTKVVKDRITVEHILPQTPSKYYWRNQFRQFTPEEIKTLSASLGNLLPLSHSINSALQNDAFHDKIARGYRNGSHSEVEVSTESDWDAERIYTRGMKLLRFMEMRWGLHFDSLAQMEELLHMQFVHDGRLIPQPLKESDQDPVIPSKASLGEDIKELRLKYWTFALPLIREAQGGEGHPYWNVNPSTSTYKDGFFGTPGIHLYCSVIHRSKRCLAGLWIDTGDLETSKAVFDVLYSHKGDIEHMIQMPVRWDRKDGSRACSIDVSLTSVNLADSDDWAKMARFHADMLKAFADYAYYPYEQEIIGAAQGK